MSVYVVAGDWAGLVDALWFIAAVLGLCLGVCAVIFGLGWLWLGSCVVRVDEDGLILRRFGRVKLAASWQQIQCVIVRTHIPKALPDVTVVTRAQSEPGAGRHPATRRTRLPLLLTTSESEAAARTIVDACFTHGAAGLHQVESDLIRQVNHVLVRIGADAAASIRRLLRRI